MRKIELNMNEQNNYQIIKKLVETNGNKLNAEIKIGCSRRHINRLIAGYKSEGKAYFQHGNTNRKPMTMIDSETRQNIIDLYRNKYYDSNFTHYTELLAKHEKISVSESSVRNILDGAHILPPKATRKTKRRMKERLQAIKSLTTSKQKIKEIDSALLEIEEAHPRRPRCAYFGEMIQMDASVHLWFGEEKAQLHAAIDDATGAIVGLYFDKQETLNGYYHIFHQILTEYGIPYMFYTDRRTVFEYKQKKSTSIEADTFTQFSYACHQLGVEIKTSSIPQAKGRVERLFQTLQSRLPVELRLKGITTIEEANIFLNSYIKEYNSQFALDPNLIKSVFEKQPSEEKINHILAVISNRKIDNGHCIRYKKEYYLPLGKDGLPKHYYKGTKALVIQAFDNQLYTSINDEIHALKLVPKHEHTSVNFDNISKVSEPDKRHIPPISHPWRQATFTNFAKKQKHRLDFEAACYTQEVLNGS
jgi:transposase